MDGTLEGDTVDLTLFFTWLLVDLGQLAFSLPLFHLFKYRWLLTQTPYNKIVWNLLIRITANSYLELLFSEMSVQGGGNNEA